MAKFTCSIRGIGTSTDCNTRAGIKSLFLGEFSLFNRTAMAEAMNQDQFGCLNEWDPAWYDNGNSTLAKWEFEREGAFYDQTYTGDTDQYEQLITIISNGKGCERTDTLRRAVLCCRLAGFVFYNTGDGRLIGMDYDGESLSVPVQALRVGRHLDSSGTLGDTLQRDELDLTGFNFNSTPYVKGVVESVLGGQTYPTQLFTSATTGVDDQNPTIATITSQAPKAGTYVLQPQEIVISNVSADTRVIFTFSVGTESVFSSQITIADTDTSVTVPELSVKTNADQTGVAMSLSMDVVDDATLDVTGGEGLTVFFFPQV